MKKILYWFLIPASVIGISIYLDNHFHTSIEDIINDINEKSIYCKIEPDSKGRFTDFYVDDKETISKNFHLTFKNDNIIAYDTFELREYYFETGGLHDAPRLQNVLKIVDSIENNRDKFPEYYKDINLEANFPALKGSSNLFAVASLLRSFEKLLMHHSKRVDIYIKGYADQTGTDWTLKQKEGYIYNSFEVYRKDNDSSLNPIQYKREKKLFEVFPRGHYKNEHLPNLRAKFYEHDIIERFVTDYIEGKGVSRDSIFVGILDGHVFSREKNHQLRKVEIFFSIKEDRISISPHVDWIMEKIKDFLKLIS